ncbi:MAG: hypothetical protein ABEK59_06530 [Halobacteria archaeon]
MNARSTVIVLSVLTAVMIGGSLASTQVELADVPSTTDGTPSVSDALPEGIEFQSDANPEIDLQHGRVTQNDNVNFYISDAEENKKYTVAIDKNNLRALHHDDNVFRYTGNVKKRGKTDDYVYAVVKTNGNGNAEGQINTVGLSTGEVRVLLFEGESPSGRRIFDDAFEVTSAEITSNIPQLKYRVGSEMSINGTAHGVDGLLMYAKDKSQPWKLVRINNRYLINVKDDNTWSIDTDELPRNLTYFNMPGVYRISMVDRNSIPSSPPPKTLNTREMNKLTGKTFLLHVLKPKFKATFSRSGEVSTGTELKYHGIAAEPGDIVIAAVGHLGNVETKVVTPSKDKFEGTLNLDNFGEGPLTVMAISPGRDDQFGNGVAQEVGKNQNTQSAEDFVQYINSLNESHRTENQIVSDIRANSVDAPASDDKIAVTHLRVTQPRMKITSIVPLKFADKHGFIPVEEGERFLVRGTTNTDPDDSAIMIKAVLGPNANRMDPDIVKYWSGNTWTANMTSDNIRPGNYTLKASNGRSITTHQFQLLGRGERKEIQTKNIPSLREKVASLQDEASRLEENTSKAIDEGSDSEANSDGSVRGSQGGENGDISNNGSAMGDQQPSDGDGPVTNDTTDGDTDTVTNSSNGTSSSSEMNETSNGTAQSNNSSSSEGGSSGDQDQNGGNGMPGFGSGIALISVLALGVGRRAYQRSR